MLAPIASTRRFSFHGDSMLPLLQDGDEVWVRPIPWEQAVPGDLMVFARFTAARPSLVVHRVVHRLLAKGLSGEGGGRSGIQTRGDACLRPDDPSRPGDFLGKVVGFRRGAVRLALESPRGRRWDAFCRFYGRLFLSWWRAPAARALEGGPWGGLARVALRLLLIPPRLAAAVMLRG